MEKIDINELKDLLKNADFEFIDDEENPERIKDFFTTFQIKKKLNIPISTAILGQGLNFMGLRRYYKGYTIPNNPDETAFTLNTNMNGEKYLTPLFKKHIIDELKHIIQEDENFQKHLSVILKKEYEATTKEKDFLICDIITTAPSPSVGKLIAIIFLSIENNNPTNKYYYFLIDPQLNQNEIEAYITPYKEGLQSTYEKTGIILPGMDVETVPHHFESKYNALRKIYKICKNKNIVSVYSDEVNDFINNYFKELNIEQDFEKIVKNHISILNIGKIKTGEYLSVFDLNKKFSIINRKPKNVLEYSQQLQNLFIKLKK